MTPPTGSDLQEIKARLSSTDLAARPFGCNFKPDGTRFKSLCPFHQEKTPSFTVFPDGNWYCFGCGRKGDVLDLVGMSLFGDGWNAHDPYMFRRAVNEAARFAGVELHASNTPKDCETVKFSGKPRGSRASVSQGDVKSCEMSVKLLAEAKGLPEIYLRSWGVANRRLSGRPVVAIPYTDAEGNLLATRYRMALSGPDRFRWQRRSHIALYGLSRLREVQEAGWVLLVEGESDVWTLWLAGVPALGVPGKTCWRSAWAELLRDLQVFVWVEPDARDLALRIGRDLPQARAIFAPEGIKDPSDAHLQGKDLGRLIEDLKARAVPLSQLLQEEANAQIRELRDAAGDVLAAEDPLVLVEQALRSLGYGGDLGPALLTYLSMTSRLLAQGQGQMPAHLMLVGPPSSGKSFTVNCVLQLMPPEGYFLIDAGSPRALIYADADLRHRAVVYAEADSLPAGEDNPAASALRSLLQEGQLRYHVVVRDLETGEYHVKEVHKPGPSVLVTTAVREPGQQLATRLFMLPMCEDRGRTTELLRARAEAELGGLAPDPLVDSLRGYQSYLQACAPWQVVVPFARQLAEALTRSAGATRILRDFSKLLALIKTVAILRHTRRQRDAQGRVVATLEDYAAVFGLTSEVFAGSITGATREVRLVVDAVAELAREGKQRITYNAVASRIGLHPEQVKRLTKVAIRYGWLVNQETRPHHPAVLALGDPLPEHDGLPLPETFTEFHKVSQGDVKRKPASCLGFTENFTISQGSGKCDTHNTCPECGSELEELAVEGKTWMKCPRCGWWQRKERRDVTR